MSSDILRPERVLVQPFGPNISIICSLWPYDKQKSHRPSASFLLTHYISARLPHLPCLYVYIYKSLPVSICFLLSSMMPLHSTATFPQASAMPYPNLFSFPYPSLHEHKGKHSAHGTPCQCCSVPTTYPDFLLRCHDCAVKTT